MVYSALSFSAQHKYHNLPVNTHGLYGSHPQIIASGCCTNTVINNALG